VGWGGGGGGVDLDSVTAPVGVEVRDVS